MIPEPTNQPLDAQRFVARLQQLHQIAASESWESQARLEAFVRLGIEAFDARAGLIARAIELETGLEENLEIKPTLEVQVYLKLEADSLRTMHGKPDAMQLDWAGFALEPNTLLMRSDSLSVSVMVHRHVYGSLNFFGIQNPNLTGNDGEFLKLLAYWISHEIERVQAQQRLRERTEQLNTVIEVSPDGILIMDQQGYILDVNPALLEMTGLERKALVGATASHFEIILGCLCGPPDPTSSAAGTCQSDVLYLLRPGLRVLKRTRRLMHDALGQVVGEVVYFRDITNEAEVSRLKSEFLSSAAHELRTPMASVYGFAELLLTREFDAATRHDLIATIHRQSGRLVKLMNDLLDLSRIEERAGKDLYILEHWLETLITKTLAMHVPKDQVARFKCPPGIAGKVYADEDKFVLALGHLIDNAITYAPVGPIEIGVICSEGFPDLLGVHVTDQGIGMNGLEAAQAFDRFFRADTSGQTPGNGLGLSLVREIMRLHDGQVTLETKPGQGTTATIWFPTQARHERTRQ